MGWVELAGLGLNPLVQVLVLFFLLGIVGLKPLVEGVVSHLRGFPGLSLGGRWCGSRPGKRSVSAQVAEAAWGEDLAYAVGGALLHQGASGDGHGNRRDGCERRRRLLMRGSYSGSTPHRKYVI